MEEPSSFWNAFTTQPGSTTITLKGRQSTSAPRCKIAAMMRLAWSRVMALMVSSTLAGRPDGHDRQRHPPPGSLRARFRERCAMGLQTHGLHFVELGENPAG